MYIGVYRSLYIDVYRSLESMFCHVSLSTDGMGKIAYKTNCLDLMLQICRPQKANTVKESSCLHWIAASPALNPMLGATIKHDQKSNSRYF